MGRKGEEQRPTFFAARISLLSGVCIEIKNVCVSKYRYQIVMGLYSFLDGDGDQRILTRISPYCLNRTGINTVEIHQFHACREWGVAVNRQWL